MAATGYTYETYEDASGEFRWRLKAANGQIVADGSEGYGSASNVRRAVRRLKKAASLVARSPIVAVERRQTAPSGSSPSLRAQKRLAAGTCIEGLPHVVKVDE